MLNFSFMETRFRRNAWRAIASSPSLPSMKGGDFLSLFAFSPPSQTHLDVRRDDPDLSPLSEAPCRVPSPGFFFFLLSGPLSVLPPFPPSLTMTFSTLSDSRLMLIELNGRYIRRCFFRKRVAFPAPPRLSPLKPLVFAPPDQSRNVALVGFSMSHCVAPPCFDCCKIFEVSPPDSRSFLEDQ